ncbi:lipopolysaccharide biosynthesis protein RfbH [Helicobacter zhangjianzhongii]|uniref:Lipopolysaccharide biosynthesis protein RfbH n=1 Tax=Helicobacter zhangjianzhongii TaxID=2974574 RepID=A0ACC6FQC8_9HELI|nr:MULTISPECIES: lipopolysaccharide biosynthesis protein RfbH [unclassified Helicobacter]MDL0079257.1 lipopolysaccharide biosynthesis protein RfbH [Helicobacter sp. CPD2-1]MDL0081287.1 lipopolysaccharide biosynthesis protein RfbH [Helicobacter sp. XJK30-2]
MTKEQLQQEIIEKVREYYALAHASRQEFIPGASRINYAGRVFDEREMANATQAVLEFWLTSGKWTKEFENKLAAYLGVKYALMVNSGSSANLLAFFALTSPLLGERQVKRGEEVITLAAGFPTTIAPMIQYGAVPVFVDIDECANIDINALESALSPKTKAVMIAHTLGSPFDIARVKAFCDAHNLWLIEDNCDALGSLYQGRKTGSFGDIGTSSFYPPHHITTGEGGAVYTSNPLLKKILLSMRDWGRECFCESGVDNTCKARFSQQCGELPYGYDHKYVYSHFGFNLKATDLQAAIGVAQLEKLESFVAKRRANHARLCELLQGVKRLRIIQAQGESEPAWFGCLMIVDSDAPFTRNDLVQHLESRGIQTRALFAGNITKHPCFTHLENGRDYRIVGDLARTNAMMERGLWVGVYPGLEQAQIEYIAKEIREFCNA